MSFIRTKGVVIKEINTGEADRVITIFSKSAGKLQGFAKGARRPRSRLAAGTQFLCYSDFVLFRGREMYSINSCDPQEPFYGIRNDVIRLTYASYLVDILNDIIQENQPSSKLLQLFLNSLHILAKTDRPPELVARIFELRSLSLLGYAPHVAECAGCGNQETDRVCFSYNKCGLICSNCAAADATAIPLTQGAAQAISHIVRSKIKDLFCFNLSPEVQSELEHINRRYLRDRLEKDYTKLDFLKELKL